MKSNHSAQTVAATAIALGMLFGCGSGTVAPFTVWEFDDGDHLDTHNTKIARNGDEASVDLRRPDAYCPSGLGDVIQGPGEVQTIVFTFDIPKKGPYWLHVVWNPGGSGDEQFEVLHDGASLGQTPVAKGMHDAPDRTETFKIPLRAGENQFVLKRISGDGLHFRRLALTSTSNLDAARGATNATKPAPSASSSTNNAPVPDPGSEPQAQQRINPSLLFKDESSYSSAIGEPGMILESENVLLFAPRSRAAEAQIIFPYLTRAYDVLHGIVGVDTNYKIIVYHFPPGSPYARGSTSECTLWYGYPNLALENQDEWVQCHVPHVSGYIEEMAHNFVDATKANFGWEMVGWSIGIKASQQVAANPVFSRSFSETRRVQAETFQRYQAAGYVFPADIAPNLVDRIHAYLLWQCEQQYGPNFWRDFFTEIRKERPRLYGAVHEQGGDAIRNARYRITVECFDRLTNLHFVQRLEQAGISRVTAIQSLHPTEPGWNHRLQ